MKSYIATLMMVLAVVFGAKAQKNPSQLLISKLCNKVKQTRAECKTKNEVFGFAYAECSQTYVKLVQGVFAIFPNRRLTSACPKLSK